MLYEPGETVVLIADIMPASINPVPPEIPRRRDGTVQPGLMYRILITERGLTIAWQGGGTVQRVDIALPPEATETATFQGGQVGEYAVKLTGGCPCKTKLLQAWDQSEIFPGTVWSQKNTLEQARVDAARDSRYGLPSDRDTPIRYSRA